MAVGDLKKRAHDALKRRQFELAVEMLQEVVSLHPQDDEAIQIFLTASTRLQEARGKSVFGGLLSKVSVGASRDPRKRITSCIRILARRPDDKGALLMLGDALMEADAPSSGVVAFRRATEIDAQDAEPWKRLGVALGRSGRIPEALEALTHALKIAPRDAEANKLRKNMAAEGALKISGYETAGSSRELIRDQNAAQALEAETRLQLTSEHAASEIEKVQAQIRESPRDARLHVRLGDLELQRGREQEARAALATAAELDPTNFDLRGRVGDLDLRQLKNVARQARDAARQSPGDEQRRMAAESAMQALVEASLKEYGRRVREHPLDLAERFRLGQWLLEAERVDEALVEFQQAVRDPNRKVASLQYQARCFERKGLLQLAAKKLEEAAASFPALASPKAKEISYEYADLLERLGDREGARRLFERLVEEDASYRDALDRLTRLSQAPA